MNVFLIEDTPEAIAQALDDTRCHKQAVECFQMLAASLAKKEVTNILRLDDSGTPVPMKHGNIGSHPATVWVEHSRESFKLVYNLGIECMREHKYRFDTVSDKLVYQARQIKPLFETIPFPTEHICWYPLMTVEQGDETKRWSPCFEWRLAKKVYQLHYSLKKPTKFTRRQPPSWLS